MPSGGRLYTKMPSYQYRKTHCGDKMILWSSYLHNGISYTLILHRPHGHPHYPSGGHIPTGRGVPGGRPPAATLTQLQPNKFASFPQSKATLTNFHPTFHTLSAPHPTAVLIHLMIQRKQTPGFSFNTYSLWWYHVLKNRKIMWKYCHSLWIDTNISARSLLRNSCRGICLICHWLQNKSNISKRINTHAIW